LISTDRDLDASALNRPKTGLDSFPVATVQYLPSSTLRNVDRDFQLIVGGGYVLRQTANSLSAGILLIADPLTLVSDKQSARVFCWKPSCRRRQLTATLKVAI